MRVLDATKYVVALVFGLTLLTTPALAQGELFGRIMGLAIEKARENAAEKGAEPAPLPKQPSLAADEPQDDYDDVAQSGGSIGLLYDTDLPYNDYRSGMEDPDLKGIRLDDCVRQCEADGQCQAFTYNAKARVCFLKHTAASPVRFKGAVSGIKGGGGSTFVPATSEGSAVADTRKLSQAEVAELQRALNAAGYDTGAPDGRVGGKTRKAVAAYRRDNPGIGGDGIDLALLLAVTSSAPAQAGSSFSSASYVPAPKAARSLALAMVAVDPGLLDDAYNVELWLREDSRDNATPGADAEQRTFWDANAIEKKAITERKAAELRNEAAAFAAEPGNHQLRIAFTRQVGLGAYVEGTGLLVGRPDDPLFVGGKLELFNERLRTDLVGAVLSMPETLAIPMNSEAEASAFINRIESSKAQIGLTAYLTLTSVGTDANTSGAAVARDGDMAVTVSLDRLALVTTYSNNSAAAPAGTELAVLMGDQQPAAVNDPLALARRLGLPLIDGRLALAADSRSEYEIGTLTRQDYSTQLWRFLNLAGLAVDPQSARGHIDNEQFVALMSTSQRIRVFGEADGSASRLDNEFDKRRAIQVFDEQIIPELVEGAPTFPIPVVAIKHVSLGDYDFESGAFPLSYIGEDRSVFLLPQNASDIRTEQVFRDLPTSLPIDEKTAESLVRGARYDENRKLVLAVFGQLHLSANRKLDIVPERVGMFRGFDFTAPLAEYEPEQYVAAPANPVPATVVAEADAESVPPATPETPAPLTGEQLAIRNGSADSPQSSFDILGIRLGMELDEARRLLDARFEGRGAVPLTLDQADSGPLTACGIVQKRLDRDLRNAASPDDHQAIRDSYIDDFAKAECPTSATSVLEFAFGYDVPQEDEGEVDRIVVFRASQSGEIVGAVAREVSAGMQEALTNGLIDKYGATFIGNEDSQYRVWPSDPSMAPLFSQGSACTPPWPELLRLPQAYYGRNCGAFVRQLYRQVLLVDTRYNLLQTQAIAEKIATAEAAQPKPKLDF